MGAVSFDPCYQHDPAVFRDQEFSWHCDDCFNNAVKEHDCKEYYLPDTTDCELCWLANT